MMSNLISNSGSAAVGEKPFVRSNVSEKVPFRELTRLCEKLSTCKGQGAIAKRKAMFTAFYKQWIDLEIKGSGQSSCLSLSDAVRFMLPDNDRQRPSYGLREHTLGRTIHKCLKLPQSTLKPILNAAKVGGHVFIETIMQEVEPRCNVRDSQVPISAINTFLTSLCERHESKKSCDDEQSSVSGSHIISMTSLLYQLAPLDIRWLIKHLLHDMSIGLSSAAIFEIIDPKAVECYAVVTSLVELCDNRLSIRGSGASIDTKDTSISVNSAFQPMLAARLTDIGEAHARLGDEFFVDTKYDGERVQIHYKHATKQFAFYSRSGLSYAHFYGTSSNDVAGHWTKYFADGVGNALPTSDFVLDGEMLLWDESTKSIRSKAFDSRSGRVDAASLARRGLRSLFVAFDVVVFGAESLQNRSLTERMQLLKKNFERFEQIGVFQISKPQLVESLAMVSHLLNVAIDDGMEGLMLKCAESKYVPGEKRPESGGWLKLKPDYVNGLCDSLDLVVVGATFGKQTTSVVRSTLKSPLLLSNSVRDDVDTGKLPTSFVCALRNDREDPTDKADIVPKYLALCEVAVGYSSQDLLSVVTKHSADFHQFKKTKKKDRGNNVSNGVYFKTYQPDVWIAPERSFVVEVKASEIVESKSHPYDQKNVFSLANVSLRFSRVTGVRFDKRTDMATTLKEFEGMRCGGGGRMVKHEPADGVIEAKSDPLPKAVIKKDAGHQGSKNVGVEGIFSGVTACVLSGDDEVTETKLKQLLKENGATLVPIAPRNPDHYRQRYGGKLMIIARRKLVRVENLLRDSYAADAIVTPQYCVGSVRDGAMTPLHGNEDVLAIGGVKVDHVVAKKTSECTKDLDATTTATGDDMGRVFVETKLGKRPFTRCIDKISSLMSSRELSEFLAHKDFDKIARID